MLLNLLEYLRLRETPGVEKLSAGILDRMLFENLSGACDETIGSRNVLDTAERPFGGK
jgi:hypothetical protein